MLRRCRGPLSRLLAEGPRLEPAGLALCPLALLARAGCARLHAAHAQPCSHPAPPPVDTHALVKALHAAGLSQPQAEALTDHVVGLLTASLERAEAKFTSKAEAERSVVAHDAALNLFRAENRMALEVVAQGVKRDADHVKAELDKRVPAAVPWLLGALPLSTLPSDVAATRP